MPLTIGTEQDSRWRVKFSKEDHYKTLQWCQLECFSPSMAPVTSNKQTSCQDPNISKLYFIIRSNWN